MIATLAAFGGRALRATFGAILRVRRPRPIHPHGLALTGSVQWLGGAAPAGIEWIDRPPPGGVQETAARVSRSVGLPKPFPDVVGLAMRFTTAEGPADLELASTGFGFPSRFWLAPHLSPSKARLTTLLPYRGSNGPVLIAARTLDPPGLPIDPAELANALAGKRWRLRLYHATLTGPWHPFATLELAPDPGAADSPLRFDGGRRPLPGARMYRFIRLLRDPSYELVQD